MVYVTFQVKPTEFLQAKGYRTGHFAILCNDIKQAKKAAANVYGIDGVTYVRINKCLRTKHKDMRVFSFYSNYEKEISVHVPNGKIIIC